MLGLLLSSHSGFLPVSQPANWDSWVSSSSRPQYVTFFFKDIWIFFIFQHFTISTSMFLYVLSVCVDYVSAVVGVNSTDRPSAIQFQSIQCKYLILDPIPESRLAYL